MRMRSVLRRCACVVASVVAACGAEAGWPKLALGPERGRAEAPTCIAHAGDGSGRIFVGERRGRVAVFGGEPAAAGTFLDISERVDGAKGGLRALAFPYDFVDKRSFCVSYVSTSGELVVARFRLARDGATADPVSEQVLLRVPNGGGERAGGGMAFGFDGKLYVGVGTGSTTPEDSEAAAQSLGSLAGKLLRIDAMGAGAAPYTVPQDNPWKREPGARPEIWALGVSSPAALVFHPETGDLYVVDSRGERWGEVDVQAGTSAGGENYGWSRLDARECRGPGPCAKAGLVPPAAALETREGCGLTQGAISRGGIYVFAERCSGQIHGLRRTPGGAWESRVLLRSKRKLSAVGAAEDGRILVADEASGTILEVALAAGAGKP